MWSQPDGGRRGRRGKRRGRGGAGRERRERRLLVKKNSILNLLHAFDVLPHPVPGPVPLRYHSLALIWISSGNLSPKQQSMKMVLMALEGTQRTTMPPIVPAHG